MERLRLILKILLLLPLWGFLLWLGFCVEPADVRVEHISAPLADWPADAAPARITIVGDIHATAWDAPKLDALVQAVIATEPEAVILLGDYFYTTGWRHFNMSPEAVAQHLAPLAEHCPVYFVLGNHDCFPELMCIHTKLERVGFIPLDTRRDHVHVFANGQGIRLRGTPFIPENEDAARLRPRFSKAHEHHHAHPLVVVSHNPYHFMRWELAGDLVLCGHTHGGQICLKRMRPFLPFSKIPLAWQRGGWHQAANGAPLYISRGTGMTKLPLRFNCPPEITVLQLRGSGSARPLN